MKILFYIIPAALILTACAKYKPNKLNYEEIFTFSTSFDESQKADGSSIVQLNLTSNKTDLKSGLKATFSSNFGTISLPSKGLDGSGNASSNLKMAQDPQTYIVSVKVEDNSTQVYYKEMEFKVQPSYPESIFIESTSSTYNIKNTSIVLKTFLSKSTGKPSQNLPIFYKAYQLDNSNNQVMVGRFEGLYNNLSTANGTYADIKFHTDTPNFDTTKVLMIEGSTNGVNAQLISKTLTFSYKK